ncbi:ABC transporter permease [Estrella lausannensis]|uniref:Oligopeptide transport system permease protein OppC n=1 Tax=Estrella lausannensis TaxID=483423 RepID=A0A0H5DSV4_9BACT|nr:ABC transporter permease [Estrella lausannensis]CRX38894.1 Putative ABC-type oligopeptide transporter, permease subunit [Estrella lausannensis]
MINTFIQDPYWRAICTRFFRHKTGVAGTVVFLFLTFLGIYAPFFASSKPLFVLYDNEPYFPLFRYLFYKGFYTKGIDLFFNLAMFFIPLFLCTFLVPKKTGRALRMTALTAFILLFLLVESGFVENPAKSRHSVPTESGEASLNFALEIQEASPYGRLNLLLEHILSKKRHDALAPLLPDYIREVQSFRKEAKDLKLPTNYQNSLAHEEQTLSLLKERVEMEGSDSKARKEDLEEIAYINERREWIENESLRVSWIVMPLIRPFHWEDGAGGDRFFNRIADITDKTRINRKDLFASLLFGIRISLVVGVLSIAISLLIGIPIGAIAGYFAGKTDLLICRLIEIWESMPAFFMLLMIIAVMQSKSIFIVILIIGLFGWTSFSRFIRGEFFKQRSLSYVDACLVLGLPKKRIIFSHILPNAIPPVLTLLPFAIMGAISSEAGLSFLGLGEEGSCSLGVLMDEGRSSFPGESYLLWPPAFVLTVFLIAIALVGDALRDTLDPKGFRF